MTPETRQEKFNSQTHALYAELGRFVVSFEELVAEMRQMTSLLAADGTAPNHGRQQQVANIFTANLTADPLAKAFRSILILALESYQPQSQVPEIKNLLSDLFSRITAINQIRNKFLHGTWHINYATQEQQDFSQAKGIKLSNTADGLRITQLDESAESFLKSTEECKTIRDIVRDISICIVTKTDILQLFRYENKKLTRVIHSIDS
ncbi:hypothetical protein PPUN15366_26130 [Pseudomonas putida]|uniref:hypothetical protein n=1 Tax=Pseudomonas putida TaxID=303 RepID=UPI00235CC419|nr:hypothetical protein [Pseudomonas putida]GLO40968.1 hypothetical protein PPUN15366_26130 [Pseudomonas putida]HDS0975881.1 hypothetical protein [Pseudomonas putida]